MTKACLTALSVLAILAAAGGAVETKIYGDSGPKDFASGEKEDVYVSENERVVLAPERTVLLEGVDYAWCAAVAADSSVYVGTVPDGRIHRIAGGEASVLFETGEAGVFSLLVLPDGSVLAGTGAEGKVFKIAPDGAGEVLADLEEPYVFGLAVEPSGAVVAVTGGGSGRIYRLGGDQPQLVYESPSEHLMSIAVADDGALYATSGDKGAIYKVAPDGAASVIFSAPEAVVQDVAVGSDGSVYAATAAIAKGNGGDEEKAVKSIMNELQAKKQTGGKSPAPPARPPKRKYKTTNVLYRIYPDGRVRPLMTLSQGLIMSVLPEGDNVLCGTAGKSGIFRVAGDGAWRERIFESESSQVLDLAPHPSGGFVATFGMPGEAVLFGKGLARKGTFTSRVLSADGLTLWGVFSWIADVPTGTKVSFEVRDGNTPTVDGTWTGWTTPSGDEGALASNLPASRYVQYRATLVTASPTVTPSVKSVSLAGLAVNLPPVVSDISVEKDGSKKPPSQGGGGSDNDTSKNGSQSSNPTGLSGEVLISWKAKDANGDKLAYSIAFRDREMKRFLTIEDDLSQTRYKWDTTSVPDGEYYFRVVATDRPSNVRETEMTTEHEDGPFTVDNTPPVMSAPEAAAAGDGWTVDTQVTDATSTVWEATYSVDGGKWEAVLPADGIFDSRSEKISVEVEKGNAAIVVIRATDRAGNSCAVRALLGGKR